MESRRNKEQDYCVTAFRVVQEIMEENESDVEEETSAVEREKASAAKLTPELPKEIARKAAQARWGDKT